ncbi:MAG: 12-oxophytodienoate reductase [Phycisphaerales bacterium]|nr:12-oxophytodienoate reductase [Phycisphaerales bacterium]
MHHDVYGELFAPARFAGLALRNRVAMAPMTRRKAPDDRVPDERIAAYYERRAAGGVGLIITEGVHVDATHAPDSGNVPGLFTDAQQRGWAEVVRRIHSAAPSPATGQGRAAVAAQLWHTGRRALDPIGPSDVPAPARHGGFHPTPRPMTERDMREVCDTFAACASRAKAAGFDAVEIHGAHGYLLDSFLSPQANTRRDDFGGPFENRARFPLMVLRAVRAAVGPGYPILYRLSHWKSEDRAALSFPDPDTLSWFCRALCDHGADLLHASTGVATDAAYPGSPRTLAAWVRSASGLPVIAVGRVSVTGTMTDSDRVETADPGPAIDLLRRGEADLLAVGRSLISNPDWCALVAAGRWRDLRPYERSLLETLA